MTKEEIIQGLYRGDSRAIKEAIKALEQSSEDCVSLEVYKQVISERDIAIEQLKELGYEFGEKIRTSEDCVSRDAIRLKIAEMPKYTDGRKTASIRHLEDFLEKEIEEPIEVTQDMCIGFTIALECIRDFITVLPPVTPTQRWIPVITREPTEEEKKDYFEQHGEELDYMIDSPMPDNGQEVLVSVGSLVSEDIFCEDSWDFENWDIADVEAWMPLPQPYEEKRGSEDGSN